MPCPAPGTATSCCASRPSWASRHWSPWAQARWSSAAGGHRPIAARFALAWRLHRAEIVAVAIAAVGLSVVLILTAMDLDRIAATCRAATEVVAPCGGLEYGVVFSNESQERLAMIGPLLGALPF